LQHKNVELKTESVVNSKKVVVYSDWWFPDSIGGAEESAREAILQLSAQQVDHRFYIVTLKNREKHPETDSGIEVHRVRSLSFRRKTEVSLLIKAVERIRLNIDFVTPWLLARKIASLAPEIVILHNIDRSGPLLIYLVRKKLPNIRIIRVYHDLGDSCLIRSRYLKSRVCELTCLHCKPKEYIHKLIVDKVDVNVFVSEFLFSRMNKLGFRFRSPHIGYPLRNMNQNFFFRGESSNLDSVIRIGYLGRISKAKGVFVLAGAAIALSEYRNIELTLYGNGSKRLIKKIEKMTSDSGVMFRQFSYSNTAMKNLSDNVDLVVVPSLWEEPFGRVPLEVLGKLKVPVFCSRIGGLRESAKFVDSNIFYFKPGDIAELADSILSYQMKSKTCICIDLKDTLYNVLLENLTP